MKIIQEQWKEESSVGWEKAVVFKTTEESIVTMPVAACSLILDDRISTKNINYVQ